MKIETLDPVYLQYEKQEVNRRMNPIIEAVCNYYQKDPRLLELKTAARDIIELKYMIYWLAKNALVRFNKQLSTTELSFRQIGLKFNEADHASVMHGIAKIENMISMIGINGNARAVNPAMKQSIEELQEILKG